MRGFNASHALNWAASMSVPRLVGTPAEVETRRRLAEVLRSFGLTVVESPFRFFPGLAFGILKVTLVLGVLLLALHRWLLSATPRWGALLGLAIPLAARHCWRLYRGAAAEKLADNRARYRRFAPFIPNAGVQLRSANLLTDLPVDGPVRRRLVLSAHTDSKSQNISIVTRAVCALLFTAGVFVLPIATAPAAIWPGWLHGFSGGLWWTVWLLAMCAGLVLAAMKVENRSPGALDDAGACGVLLEVARVLCEQPPKGVAVRVLLTGAEELGLAGGYHYVRQLRDDPAWREAYYLNLEGVGEGRKIWLTTGTGPDRAADQAAAKTLELAEASCQEHGIAPRRLSRLVGGEADHIPMIEAGLAAVTLMFAGPHGTRIHTSGDGPELLRPDGLELAGRVVLSAVRRLEEV